MACTEAQDRQDDDPVDDDDEDAEEEEEDTEGSNSTVYSFKKGFGDTPTLSGEKGEDTEIWGSDGVSVAVSGVGGRDDESGS